MAQQDDLSTQFEAGIVRGLINELVLAQDAIRPYLEKLPADKRELASAGLKHESPRAYLIYLSLACDVPVPIAQRMVEAEYALNPHVRHPVFQAWLKELEGLRGQGDDG